MMEIVHVKIYNERFKGTWNKFKTIHNKDRLTGYILVVSKREAYWFKTKREALIKILMLN